MSTIYVICKTTGYGNFHTPIYIETSIKEANKLKDQLQVAYDKLNKATKANIAKCNIASIFKVEVNSMFNNFGVMKLVYQRKPVYCVTNLDNDLRIYDPKDKEIVDKNHEHDKKTYNWYDSKVFMLDINKELEEVGKAINSSYEEDDTW